MVPPHLVRYRGAMIDRDGFTLIELAWVLVLGAFLLALATPMFLRGRDAIAVRAAREHLLQSVALARALAPGLGGSEILLEPAAGRVSVRSSGRVHESHSLAALYGVQLSVQGSTQPLVSLRFDGLGIGRLANRTIAVERGAARAGVTLSMYGRTRAW